MRTLRFAPLLAALAFSPALARERTEIAEKYTWNLADLYPTEAAWTTDHDALHAQLPALAKLKGHLGESPEQLFKALDAIWAAQLKLERLSVYASSLADQDTRATRPQELKQLAEALQVDFGSAISWLDPELLALGPAKLKAFQVRDPRLKPWAFYLSDVLRKRPHTLTPEQEQLVAEAGNLSNGGQTTHGILSNADLPYPTVKLSTGEVRLDPQAYTLYRAAPLKADREKVFAAFFGALKVYERTFGTTMDAQLKAHSFTRKVRHYDSTLDAALFPNAIPTAVYKQLVTDVRRSLPTLHRYLKLRQRMLGLSKLQYSDLYVPLVSQVKLTYTPEEAQGLTLEAVAPLGTDYVEGLKKGFNSRWTDFLPSTGKRSGAYSTGVWGVHPIQLLNFNGQYEDLTTLAHEAGHSMHTALANAAQPYPTSGYPTFVAEIASTLNENLLLHHLLDTTKDDSTRLAILGNFLDGLRGTLFRQTQFAEFELAMHELADKGEPITGEALSKVYLRQVRDYYGHDQGICEVPDAIAVEWAYIPHFYYNFYVFQYATSLTISTALAQNIRAAPAGSTAARDRYLNLLRSGGSNYPVDLVKAAGVDPTTSAPFDAAMKEMNQVMDEMDGILARQKPATK
jgi:oligoendopeptidase F